jgi:hypothetical protein
MNFNDVRDDSDSGDERLRYASDQVSAATDVVAPVKAVKRPRLTLSENLLLSEDKGIPRLVRS